MSDRFEADDLASLFRGELTQPQVKSLVRSLLQAEAGAVAALPEADRHYDGAINRAHRAAVRFEHRNHLRKAEARKLEAVLAQGGIEAVERLARRPSPLALLDALLSLSWALRHESPARMEQLAGLAARQADRLDVRVHGLAQTLDLRCRAWAEHGNAYRVGDKLDQAAAALEHARSVFALGTGDQFLEIRLIELEASLAADLRQFDRASSKLVKVFRFYRQIGDDHLTGRALILRGLYVGYGGDPEGGIRLLRQGISLLEEEREPGLAQAAIHNQILFLVDCGLFQEARQLRVQHSRKLDPTSDRVSQVRLHGLDGRIEAGLGNHARAEAIFRETKQGFEEVGRGYHAAIAALDVAAALLAQRRPVEAKEVVFEAANRFRALRIEREMLAAVLMLREAFEMHLGSLELIHKTAAFFRQAERDPETRRLDAPL